VRNFDRWKLYSQIQSAIIHRQCIGSWVCLNTTRGFWDEMYSQHCWGHSTMLGSKVQIQTQALILRTWTCFHQDWVWLVRWLCSDPSIWTVVIVIQNILLLTIVQTQLTYSQTVCVINSSSEEMLMIAISKCVLHQEIMTICRPLTCDMQNTTFEVTTLHMPTTHASWRTFSPIHTQSVNVECSST